MKATMCCGRCRAVAVAMAGVLAVAVGGVQAGTIYVSTSGNDANEGLSWNTSKATVQAGLDAAVAGDEVWVAAGLYGKVTLKAEVALYGGFAGTETDLAQRNWTANVTVLDANQAGRVVTVPSAATSATRIDGFTIRNGRTSGAGAGVYCPSASPTITNNTITGNTASQYGGISATGGGICCTSSTATISNNTIMGNSATGSYGSGGGIYWTGSVTVVNNLIVGNSAAKRGGGIESGSSGAIIGNRILGNSIAASDGTGGGVSCGGDVVVTNNTIAGNTAVSGGGVYCSGTPTISNSIVAFNSSGIHRYSGTLSLQYNCVYGNTIYDYSGLTDPTGTSGNISADPMLAGVVYGDVHLQPGSPCINAGGNGAVLPTWVDMDGQPRTQGGQVDIGADESDGTAWPTGPRIVVRVSPAGSDDNDGSSWSMAKRTVQAAIDAAATAGGEVWIAAGTYAEVVTLRSWAHIYGGFAGTETERSQRDCSANVTILDCNQSGHVVTVQPGGFGWSTVDGFTIRNSNAGSGFGIYCLPCSSPAIANNVISGHRTSGIRCDNYCQATINANTISGGAREGIYCYYSTAVTITNNTITDNGGSGIACNRSWADITGNTITGNTAGTNGGGISCQASSPTIRSNTISGNAAPGFGGAICCDYYASAVITNNTITANSSQTSGGAIYCMSYSSPMIANNTITANGATSSGGAVYCTSSSSPTLANNTIAGNFSDSGAAVYCQAGSLAITNCIVAFNTSGIHQNAGSTLSLRYNCVYGNSDYNYSGLTDPTGTNGNISADPRLAWPVYVNVHIQPDSPCLNAGDDSVVQAGWVDMDGQARTQGARVDIGADESDGTVWPSGGDMVIRVSPSGNDANDGSSWTLAKRTVQAAVNTAGASHGQVWVAAGTYVENVAMPIDMAIYGGFAGTETDLAERDWAANPTVLDGGAAGSVITIPARATRATRVDGLTLRNGSGTLVNNLRYGGAIYCTNGSPTIVNDTITANTAAFGAGIYCNAGSPHIAGNTITSNNVTTGGGGGIYCTSTCAATITGNTITGNSVLNNYAAPYGGGIFCAGEFSTITNNTISGNSTTGSGGGAGGGIYCSAGITIAGNTVADNSAADPGSGRGGGIFCDTASQTVLGNHITGNRADKGAGIYCRSGSAMIANNSLSANMAVTAGGGLYSAVSTSTIANNTFLANAAPNGGALYCDAGSPVVVNSIVAFNSSGICSVGGAEPSLRYNCVYGNPAYNYSGVTDPTGTAGNISSDPGFAQPFYTNWHIQPNSPCVDSGDDSVAQAGRVDADGQPRQQGAHVDIGADESDGTAWPFVPGVIVHVSLSGDDANDGSSWALAKRTVQGGINAAASTNGQVWVAAGTYLENVTLAPGIALYGGFSGSETDLSQRNHKANVTVLDGNQAGSVVTVAPAATAMTRIDGFTIRNGVGSYQPPGYPCGAGILCVNSSPTIANNTITCNGNYLGYRVEYGGGIYCGYSSPIITNNTIVSNGAAYGGGIYCDNSLATIANNTISSNGAYTGGGVYCLSSSPAMTNNTIAGNGASSGGGIYCNSSSPMITNTIIAYNASGLCSSGGGMPAVRYGCVYGNSAYDYMGVTDPTGIDGNVSADPRLASVAYGNTHIEPDSPCMDAGDPSAIQPGWTDVDGQPRRQGSRVDIGADESDGTVWPAGPYAIVRVSPSGNDANDGSTWALAKRTVQAGIDAAAAGGGEVWVAAGSYAGPFSLRNFAYVYGGFAGTEADRAARDWSGNMTVLDGGTNQHVVTANWLGRETCAIDGFTILNGSYGIYCCASSPMIENNTITGTVAALPSGGGIGGYSGSQATAGNSGASNIVPSCTEGSGIYCDASSATIRNNTINANNAIGISCTSGSPKIVGNTITANAYGGISCTDAAPTITNNTITDNMAGGGIHCASGSAMIAGNTITGNTATTYNGGGIGCYGGSQVITHNRIAGNAASNGSGGGIYCDASSTGTISNNAITGNSAGYGGGIGCDSSSSRLIANNTITANTASSAGGGVRCAWYSTITIANNTITGNSSLAGGGIHGGAGLIAGTIIAFNSSGFCGNPTTVLRSNCVYGNSAYNYLGLADPTGTNGNIGVDPKLAWPFYVNVHIQPDSPCIDAGDDSAVQAGWTDMDGQARVQGSHVDIGADESDGTLWPGGGSIIVRVSPGGSDANDGSSWALAKGSVQAAIDAATATGGEVWVAAGTYLENVAMPLGVSIYGGFAGGETDLSQRDWTTSISILDGNQQGDVVTVRPGAVQSTRIDGFTIRNGSRGISCPSSSPIIANNAVTANSGGGILCSGSPTITNNTITANSAGSGGGIYSSPGSPTITDNVITGNAASDGGGIYCNAGQPTIVRNTITGNTASSAGGGIACASSNPTIAGNTIAGNTSANHGGGIDCNSSPSALIMNNAISGNSAATTSGSGYGGAIYCYSGSPRIIGNTITGNDATAQNTARGGGIYASSSSVTIANNVILGNRANSSNSTGDGGGIYCAFGSPKIANNTVVGNTASSNGGGFSCSSSGATIAGTILAFNSSGLYKTGSPAPTLRYNCVYGNTAYNYSGLTDPTGTNGNISTDPRLVRAASPGMDSIWGTADDDYGDLHLLPGSPCIDAGSNPDVPADAADLDGDGDTAEPLPFDLAGAARFADDPYMPDTGGGAAPIVDMGAYEHRLADANGDGFVDVADLLGVVYAFGTMAGDPTYDATCDFNHDGAVDVVDLLDLVYNFGT